MSIMRLSKVFRGCTASLVVFGAAAVLGSAPVRAADDELTFDQKIMRGIMDGLGLKRDGEAMGEVMMRGNVVMKGYLKNKSSTERSFAGGWFHTGDLGVMHPDGYIQLKDRSKDIIISGGENISSIEVEDTLYKHPAVAAAAVVAKPDDKWGETPCAFIELKPGTKATTDELVQWCRKHLASYKCPRYVVFAEIPKTSTGKIQKFKLREMAKAV